MQLPLRCHEPCGNGTKVHLDGDTTGPRHSRVRRWPLLGGGVRAGLVARGCVLREGNNPRLPPFGPRLTRHRDEHGQQAPEGLVKWGRLDSHPLLARGGCTTVALVGSTPVIRSTKEHHRASTSPHPRCRSGQHAWPHGCRCQRGWSDSQLSQPDPDLLLPQWYVVAGPRTRNLGLQRSDPGLTTTGGTLAAAGVPPSSGGYGSGGTASATARSAHEDRAGRPPA